jgi:plasmid maintenance system antidote protein VapI
MTLQEFLKQYGIKQPIDLARAADIDRRHAWMIWHGQRGIGPKIALRLFQKHGISLEQLLQLKAGDEEVPRGRQRKKS